MSEVIRALRFHACSQPAAIALEGGGVSLDYRAAARQVDRLAVLLGAAGRLGVLMDNGPAWAVADLAMLAAGVGQVPLPPFFSDSQLSHAIADAGVDGILTDQPERVGALLRGAGTTAGPVVLPGKTVYLFRFSRRSTADFGHAAKLTYTSGTTGQPKGVLLDLAAVEQVALSLMEASGATPADRHLSVLPMPTLLENIGGLYAPLLAGARSILPPLAEVGVGGSSQLDAGRLVQALHAHRATTTILVPQMLFAMVHALRAGAPLPTALRFIAVGGATVSATLLQQAAAFGLPVFQGYGLSECASVVALNTQSANRPGSVGRPLPHVRLRLAADGEILVGGALFQGYIGQGPAPVDTEGFFPSGDLGHLDDDGYLWLTGRKKNLYITAFGRNVAPEWVEGELAGHYAIAQAALFGDGLPWNTAVIVPRQMPGRGALSAVAEAVAAANAGLPDYARVGRWILAEESFTPANGQLTANGRPRREAIWAAYASRIEYLYQQEEEIHDVL
ncbi:MAG: long-chain acyl-CoA synthetase [Hydrogenophilales bacterium CG_4_9_14_3_um_filter_59_35]|nr:MAG: long-chain acyl-CoA synthetase [Hydrogenophilales bacterium CG18_big_fil_WC_8_21_14_2_50_58_12]PIX99208.1 MAG: long-chain acyl-CoA synthetase [Hydrogenophilales bacterium CG_4_10_14_3_um_filter_58_23]PJB08593.1 MAG: long-chain acyl-CoA synthetase [Hydrogenophilales bacterium CG_4_9_14_3_um_filter_59_35]